MVRGGKVLLVEDFQNRIRYLRRVKMIALASRRNLYNNPRTRRDEDVRQLCV